MLGSSAFCFVSLHPCSSSFSSFKLIIIIIPPAPPPSYPTPFLPPPPASHQVVVLNQVLAADANVGYEEIVNTQVRGS